MSKPVHISSSSQFQSLLKSSRLVVADFWADWCGPCKTIAPIFEQLAGQLSRPNEITFVKVNSDQQTQLAQAYKISALPTFLVFKSGNEVSRIEGANAKALSEAVKKLAAEAGGSSSGGFGESSSSGGLWRGASLPRGYTDVTEDVDKQGLDLLNADFEIAGARTLFETSQPSSLRSGKAKAGGESGEKDWIESDTDEQLMLFVPFQATLKVHTIQLTSLPPKPTGDDMAIMRPKTIKLYTNRAHNLGFEEADDIPPTQVLEIGASDWDEKTGTAKLELRFVKFQNVTSIVLFAVDGDGDGDKVRLDRVRIIGESGVKREMGELKKVGDEGGE